MVLYPILLSQTWSTTVSNFMLVSRITQSGQNLALSRLATMIIYLLTFYLFDEIEKIPKSLMRIILQRRRQFRQKCSCNLNVYIFYLRFALGIIHVDRCNWIPGETSDPQPPNRHPLILFCQDPPPRGRNLRTPYDENLWIRA